MLTDHEERFIKYWEANRERKKRVRNQLSVGLPLSSVLVIAIFINFFSGWYKRAEMMIRSNSSMILVIVIAAVLIVVFTTVFSVRHKWEMNEQHYRELLARKNKP
jgi:membrane protein YdbS with pleckstrin-like domain